MGDLPDTGQGSAGQSHPRIEELRRKLRFDNGSEKFAWFVRVGPAIPLKEGSKEPPPENYSVNTKMDREHGLPYWLSEKWGWVADLIDAAQFGTREEAEDAAANMVMKYPQFVGKVDAIPLGIPYNPEQETRDAESSLPKGP